MKFTPYQKLLSMTSEALDAVLVSLRSSSARKQVELELAKVDERLAVLEKETTVLCSSKELNINGIIDKLDDIGLAERRKKQLQQIKDEMFP